MFQRLSFFLLLKFTLCLVPLESHAQRAEKGSWRPLKTGGGGWITGLHVHPSGDPVLARSDVGGAYRWDEASRAWTNIVTAKNLPQEDVYWSKHSGVLSIVSAPSDPSIAYMAYQECIYRSNDSGDHWQRTNFPKIRMSPNEDASKLSGERLCVDPLNAEVVYFGSINDGLWRTNDGGKHWSSVTDVPRGKDNHGIRQVLFDATHREGSRTSRLLAIIDGVGVLESKDAGKSWQDTKLTAVEPRFYDSEISSSGRLYVCGVGTQGRTFYVQRYDGKKWTSIFSESGHAIGEIALDPLNDGRAVLMTHGFSDTYLCNDLQQKQPSWKKLTYDREAENIPWLSWAEGGWFSLGEVVFDPKVRDRLWIAEGTGVWTTNDLGGNTITWHETTLGQEHLVSSDIVSMPNGESITAHWDRPIFLHNQADRFPDQHGPTHRFNSAWSLDRHPDDPKFVVAIIEDHRYCCYDEQHRNSGFSTDGGKTWQRFVSHPEFRGKDSIHGQIAVSAGNRDNIVWLPVWNSMPYFTTDRGKAWTKAELPGNSGNCCIAAPWFQREAVCADRVLESTFYIYDWAEGHVFRSKDGGQSWQRFTSVLPKWTYHGRLKSVHKHANHLWFAPGRQESVRSIGPLMRSIDGGKTWTSLRTTDEVLNVAFGKGTKDTDYPSVFIQGRVDGDFGYFMSNDEGKTWLKIGEHPLGIYDAGKVMDGDPWQHGRLYVGFGGNGFVYYNLNSK